ncbi:hypothetical protein VP1G_11199 [Cytospora mali]|uniref:Mmc1 C-terminal domain-containing protein n=1 Tax=Cytospora mali TaxID=578113 RepID=A0A194VAX4_CYTMA|nr:hypothetical protein VP1G_11199 [Valsa mali var. pyri (nom. inval.)]
MPPRLSLRSVAARSHPLKRAIGAQPPTPTPSVCLFCSLSPRPTTTTTTTTTTPRRTTTRRKSLTTRRNQSTATAPAPPPENPREELQEALQELQKHAANYVNLSRVQLALNSLRQEAGDETIRLAILGLADGSSSEPARTAKEVLRLLLADPLSAEQAWERELMGHDARQPLIVRVGAEHQEEGGEGGGGNKGVTVTYAKGTLLKEINVSSPGLNGHKLEILLTESNPLADSTAGAFQDFEEAALVPTVDIPTSNTGRYSPVTTPVHKALLVTDGLVGAASLVKLPLLLHKDTIAAAVDLPGYTPQDGSALPFTTIDVKAASQGLDAFRQSIDKGFEYERSWFKSNVPAIVTWLKSGVTLTDDGVTKAAVRNMTASILRNTLAAIQEEEARRLASALSSEVASKDASSLNPSLAEWAEKAHAELQEEMDKAFTSRRWRQLNWWKLFWRVDDVGVLSSEMLSQRFLPAAERNVIYLAGKIEGSGLFGPEGSEKGPYALPTLSSALGSPSKTAKAAPVLSMPESAKVLGTKWPTHITFTRNYLQTETVPALQALAQRLVLQSTSFSTLTTALGTLMYLSSYGISESGAVAAFGIMWSLRRLQKKWETAREYWQSEVREEGRKAVRAVEISVGEALDKALVKETEAGSQGEDEAQLQELRRARELVQKAEEALEKLK